MICWIFGFVYGKINGCDAVVGVENMIVGIRLWFSCLNLQCVLPAGVEFYASGYDPNDPATFPRSYPIVLTGMQE